MKKKGIIISAVIVIAAAVCLYVYFTRSNGSDSYKTEKVETGDIIFLVTATGTVNAVTTVAVGTQISGIIQKMYVDYNSVVTKGQLLALIDPSVIEAQVAQANANVLSAKANAEKSRAALQYAKVTFERNKELYQKGFISKNDLDQAETNYISARAQLSANEAAIKQAQASLNQYNTNLGYTKITSPINGMVISRSVDVGQTVAASFSTPTLFSIAEDLTKMQIDTNIDEADIGKIKNNQAVEFTVDAYPDLIFKGNVSEIRNAPVTVSNVVTYDVIVRVDNPDLKLKPGMTANVSIIVEKKEKVLRVPDSALKFNPNKKSEGKGKRKGTAVWVLKGDKPKRVEIEAGLSDGAYTQVVSGKLKEGDEVITEGSASGKTGTNKSNRRMGPPMF